MISLVNSAICVPFLALHIPGRLLIKSTVYQNIMGYIIGQNVDYAILLPHPFVCGFYFKEIH